MNTAKYIVVIFGWTLSILVGVSRNLHGAAAWESEWERTVKAAEQEGEINYYSLGEVGFD